MKTGDAIAEILKREGVEWIIGYPVNHILEHGAAAGIRPIVVRQERIGLHMDNTPDVPPDAHLLVIEGNAKVPAPYAATVTRLESAGLDRTSAGRGIAIVPHGRLTAGLFDLEGVRIFKPICPRIAK